MKFRHKVRNMTYIVRAQDIIVESGHKTVTKGLKAKFVNGEFDSEAAQKSLGWSDEDREHVEAYLHAHPDYGRGMYGVQGRDEARIAEALEPHTCLAMYVVQGESQTCGRPCEGDFCPEHEAEMNTREALEV